MGRSGYGEYECDSNMEFLWPSIIKRSIKGKRGQAFLRELARELDAMPVKRLIKDAVVTPEGECCTMGVVFKARGIDAERFNEEYAWEYASTLGIARSLAQEIAYENDEKPYPPLDHEETPEERWVRMRKWVDKQLGDELP